MDIWGWSSEEEKVTSTWNSYIRLGRAKWNYERKNQAVWESLRSEAQGRLAEDKEGKKDKECS